MFRLLLPLVLSLVGATDTLKRVLKIHNSGVIMNTKGMRAKVTTSKDISKRKTQLVCMKAYTHY
jgi:hypothetical protein